MTTPWSMSPDRPRRLRRLVALAALAGTFALSATAGWAVADPAAFGAAIDGIARIAPPGGAAPGAPAPGPGAGSGVPASPGAAASPGAGSGVPAPSSTPTSTPTPRPAILPSAPITPTPGVPRAVAARLDRALARAQQALLLPGVAATVILADGSTWTGALGLADAAAGRPVRPGTPFAAASVTKTFIAALVLRYVDQGLIGLDDPLAGWLPEWPNARRITIRMLLNHTSGIPDFFRNPELDLALNRDMKRSWTTAEVLEGYVTNGAVFPPGRGWSYSNTNYLLLGLVAAEVGGAPWEALVRRELIEPLGLHSTYVQAVEEPLTPPAIAHRIIDGYRGPTPQARTDGSTVVPFRSVVTAAGPAGALASTTGDLARWAQALYRGTAVVSPATRRQMLTFVETSAYGNGTSYGLGVSRMRFNGRSAFGHSGALVGTRAAIRYFPREKVTVAVLFNRDTFVGDDVVRILARAIFPEPAASPTPTPAP
ncbi:MAG TPA: serine hydrolase domain-containing protein [Patescibacteria group bacterium]|nr:serine hydrolase domain-containing protein [Patescibacteria group bacterium]